MLPKRNTKGRGNSLIEESFSKDGKGTYRTVFQLFFYISGNIVCLFLFSVKCPYKGCDEFITPKNMARHKNTLHLDEKKFKCNTCEKTFTTKRNAQVHESKCDQS